MDFPPSPSVFYIDDDPDDDQIQYFDNSRPFNHQVSTSYEMINRAEKKRKLTNHHQPSTMPLLHGHGPKRPRNQPFEQGRNETTHSIQSASGSAFEPILLDPDEYVIEEPETHSFHAFDWTLDQRRAATTLNNSVTLRKPSLVPLLPPPPPPPPPLSMAMPNINMIDTRTPLSLKRNEIRRRSSPIEPPPLPPLASQQQQQQQQQQRKLLPVPVALPPAGPIPLPLPKPTAALSQTPSKRGRPTKPVRTPRSLEPSPPTPTVRSALELPPVPPASTRSAAASNPPVFQSHSEIRRQTLNGTGIFSAFHDTKYYRCNICKFKSVTSSTLLQHLFTHLFFCHNCSYYTFSHYQLAQHLFDKHQVNFLEDNSKLTNPTTFDLLYLTRCADGTFALCMDASASSPTQENPPQTSSSSSSSFNPSKSIPTKKRKISRPEEPITTTVAVERQVSSERVEIVEKKAKIFVPMKSRTFYSLRKPTCLHALTLEHEICRRETIENKFQYSKIQQRKATQRTDQPRRLVEEIAHCLRTVVNQIVDEENETKIIKNYSTVHSSLVCALPEQVLCSIFPQDDLKQLTNALKLIPKSRKFAENREKSTIDRWENHVFVLGISDAIHDEQIILSSLHSNTTNGEMVFTQTKLPKLPLACDNTFRFFRTPNNNRVRPTPKKPAAKAAKTPSPPQVLSGPPVMSNSATNISSTPNRVDRNNNSITSSQSKGSSNSPPADSPLVIVLD